MLSSLTKPIEMPEFEDLHKELFVPMPEYTKPSIRFEEEKVRDCPEDDECTICSESLTDSEVKNRMNGETPPEIMDLPISEMNNFSNSKKKKKVLKVSSKSKVDNFSRLELECGHNKYHRKCIL